MFLYISAIVLGLMLITRYVFNRTGLFTKKGDKSFVWKIMHFLGGFFVAMFWSGLIGSSFVVIGLVLLVGLAWEFWEYFYGLYKFKTESIRRYMTKISDTIEDLILDIIGAVAWVIIFNNFL